jgi:hypothetical protein
VIAASLSLCALKMAVAEQATYCVTCKNPDQTYVCRVDAGGARASDALKLYCIIRTAKEGHHASCAAERDSPACQGVVKVYSYDGPVPEDIASDPRIKHLTDKLQRDQQTFADKPKGNQPKTLVELTGRAVSASRKGLRNARGALGGSSEPSDQPLPDEALPSTQSGVPPVTESPPIESAAAQPNRMQRAYRCVVSLFRSCGSSGAAPQ